MTAALYANAICALGIFTLWGFYIVYRADDLSAMAARIW